MTINVSINGRKLFDWTGDAKEVGKIDKWVRRVARNEGVTPDLVAQAALFGALKKGRPQTFTRGDATRMQGDRGEQWRPPSSGTNELKHHLLSLPLDRASTLHAYMMTDKPTDALPALLEAACNKMIHLIEDSDREEAMPTIEITSLSPKLIKIVQAIIEVECSKAKEGWETATDFHFTTWVMRNSDPRNKRLMVAVCRHRQRLHAIQISGVPMRSQPN
jgi:hypothetical protein